MIHPLQEDLSQLKDNDIEHKVQELTRKYFMAARLGNHQVLTQISTFLTIYTGELSRRYIEKSKTELNGDLDQLINVD